MINRERAEKIVADYFRARLQPSGLDELVDTIAAALDQAEARGIAKHAIR